jgi:two-component system, cell cycle sensor histidine kinase and response regulator CckA
MESIGRLAGGIAHDFNNIMTAVLGFGSMILDQLGDNHPLQHAVEQIVSAGERATNLTRQLLTFSRRQITEVRILDLNAVVTEMYQLLRRALGEDVELITVLDDNPASIKADAGLLQQVIMNLAINARDAMPRGGQLTIQTQRVTLDDRFCRSRVDVRPGDYVLLSVRDTGSGMTKEVLDHMFEPFFTTKPKGKGTGLGLATVYGIVRQCGGHIEVESEPGVGTEVKVWMPRVATPEEAVPVELEARPERGSETILVVEDEDIVRDLTVRLLKSLGYKVLEASHGREALAVVDQCKSPIHLVLTDVVMPQMGGPELAERLQKIRPSVKLLYTSGFTESAVLERGVALGKVRLIQKPYSRETLAQRVRETLDEG